MRIPRRCTSPTTGMVRGMVWGEAHGNGDARRSSKAGYRSGIDRIMYIVDGHSKGARLGRSPNCRVSHAVFLFLSTRSHIVNRQGVNRHEEIHDARRTRNRSDLSPCASPVACSIRDRPLAPWGAPGRAEIAAGTLHAAGLAMSNFPLLGSWTDRPLTVRRRCLFVTGLSDMAP